jgi:hypothetical protein
MSLASKARIHFCSSKGARLWLVAKPSICSFRIAHSTFISMLCFRFDLIQHLMCECGHGLDAFGTHLICCAFGSQRIAIDDTIQDIMYSLAWKSGHIVLK